MGLDDNQTHNKMLRAINNLTDMDMASSSSSSSTDESTTGPEPQPQMGDGIPGWTVLLIVAACIILLLSLGIGGYLLAKRVKDRRKNHGEYKPQQVEHMHAKDLPYITPPNIEGLI